METIEKIMETNEPEKEYGEGIKSYIYFNLNMLIKESED